MDHFQVVILQLVGRDLVEPMSLRGGWAISLRPVWQLATLGAELVPVTFSVIPVYHHGKEAGILLWIEHWTIFSRNLISYLIIVGIISRTFICIIPISGIIIIALI